jgi:hypothetical protein
LAGDEGWSHEFGYPGLGGWAYAVTTFGDELIVAGSFERVGDTVVNNIARWDGMTWRPLNVGTNGEIRALALYNGDLIAAGAFTEAGGAPAAHVARWDGTSWSPLGDGVNGWVAALAVYNGSLIAGGSFDNGNMAAWDGSAWTPLGSGTDGPVLALAVYNTLVAGGQFTHAGGVAVFNVASWNGSSWAIVGVDAMSGYVRALASTQEELIAGGSFGLENEAAVNIASSNNLLRFAWPTGQATDGEVLALFPWVGYLAAGGVFRQAGDATVNGIGVWDGDSWQALDGGVDGWVGALGEYSIGLQGGRSPVPHSLVVGGSFGLAGGVKAGGIAVWDRGWHPIVPGEGAGLSGTVRSIFVDGTEVIAAGDFPELGGVARWDDSSWNPLGFPWPYTINSVIKNGNDVYAAGHTELGPVLIGFVSRYDGTSWELVGDWFTSGPVEALAFLGSDLVAGGEFAYVNGEPAGHLARWNGAEWAPLATGTDGPVYSLVQYGDDLAIGGAFSYMGSTLVGNIVRYSASGEYQALGAGADGWIEALAVAGNDLYAGGGFSHAGEVEASHVARWDGAAWNPLGVGVDQTVHALAWQDGAVVAGGEFEQAGGSPANHIARWSEGAWEAIGSGTNAPVTALAARGADVFAGGAFTEAGGAVAYHIARWSSGVIPGTPEPFSLLEPAEEETLATRRPTMRWRASRDAGDSVHYALYWTSTAEWDSVEAGADTTFAFVTDSLAPGARYTWKVRAFDLEGHSRWSDPLGGRHFVILGETPCLVSPEAAWTPDGVMLRWTWGLDGVFVGFRVHRRIEDGEWERISPDLVPGEGGCEYLDREAEPGARYEYQVEGWDLSGQSRYFGPILIDTGGRVPLAIRAFPNPVTTGITVELMLPRGGPTRLSLYNPAGRLVATLLDGQLPPGAHQVAFSRSELSGASNGPLPSGVYALRLDSPGGTRRARIVVLR